MSDVAVRTSFAVPLSCGLPNEMPLDSWPCSTEDSAEWYAVVAVVVEPCEDKDGAFEVETAVILDVRRMDWPLPDGAIDLRAAHIQERPA